MSESKVAAEIEKRLQPGKDPSTVILELKVIPGAKISAWDGFWSEHAFKLRIQAPPVDGAANKALLKFMARSLNLKKQKLSLVSGESSRSKRVSLQCSKQEALKKLLDVMN